MATIKYSCSRTYEPSDGSYYYVRLRKGTNFKPKITFKQGDSSLLLTFNFWLDGTYNFPSNMLIMNLETSIGTISNLILYEVTDKINFKEYQVSVNINLNNTSSLNSDLFLKELYFSASLDVDKDIYNNSNLPAYFANVYKDILKVNFDSTIYFNNYFPISKLSEHYINSNYKNDYKNITTLPKDFYNWATKEMTLYPEFWFNKATVFEGLEYKTIDNIYQINTTETLLSKTFDKVSVVVSYYVDSVEKKLTLDFTNAIESNVNSVNNLYLGIKTLYNFETKELYQSNSGISGVYFPITTSGNLTINLEKNGIKYQDKIPYSFSNEFYSQNNKNIDIVVEDFFQVSGQWTEVTYA